MQKNSLFSEAILVIFLGILAASVGVREYGVCSSKKPNYGPCGHGKFRCADGVCIQKKYYCDGNTHCADYSDELYCAHSYSDYYSACPDAYVKCSSSRKCIPKEWQCDGINDCITDKSDEEDCKELELKEESTNSIKKAIAWMVNQKVDASSTRKWGPHVHKLAVALYLTDPKFLLPDSAVRKEITYELSIQLLSRLSKKKIENISSSDLASFVHALLVTCTDPRDFHGLNLVQELRSRINNQNYTNPYVLLTLCNAGDTLDESDIRRLIEAFWSNNRKLWTDVQAISLMALSCARNQTDSSVDAETIHELALELKLRQYRNGTVENLRNTFLVMQALYAAEPDEDTDNFDEKKALSYIIENQQPDGSFGNIFMTYYALPVLSCKSLVNMSSSHCQKTKKDEGTAAFDLVHYAGPKEQIRFSVWIGMERDIERTLALRVPTDTSFYEVMEIAAEIDNRYKFDYVVKDRKPYVTSIFGIEDDPESEQFWFPYILKDKKPTLLTKSTVDVALGKDDHIIMWYRNGNWIE